MSKLLYMRSEPILNIKDYYDYFNVIDILRNREAFFGFALGQFGRSKDLKDFHCKIIKRMADGGEDDKMMITPPVDYWNDGKALLENKDSDDSAKPQDKKKGKGDADFSTMPEYERQEKIAADIYDKYRRGLSGDDGKKIIMLVTAAVLLAEKDINCLNGISAEQLKNSYLRDGGKIGADNDVRIEIKGDEASMKLPAFEGEYCISMDSSRRPNSGKRWKTFVFIAQSDSVRLRFERTAAEEAETYHLNRGERLYCLVLDDVVTRVLPNEVSNGDNVMERRADGIYLNRQKCPIPLEVSSFAVSCDRIPQYLYVHNGYISYSNYSNLNGAQKVSEQIAVISEVRLIGNGRPIVIRNDGKVWDNGKFVESIGR